MQSPGLKNNWQDNNFNTSLLSDLMPCPRATCRYLIYHMKSEPHTWQYWPTGKHGPPPSHIFKKRTSGWEPAPLFLSPGWPHLVLGKAFPFVHPCTQPWPGLWLHRWALSSLPLSSGLPLWWVSHTKFQVPLWFHTPLASSSKDLPSLILSFHWEGRLIQHPDPAARQTIPSIIHPLTALVSPLATLRHAHWARAHLKHATCFHTSVFAHTVPSARWAFDRHHPWKYSHKSSS